MKKFIMILLMTFATGLIAQEVKIEAVEMAIKDMQKRFRKQYPNGAKFIKRLDEIKKMQGDEKNKALADLQRTALLENPLLKRFDKILAVRRKLGNARGEEHPGVPGAAYNLEHTNLNGNDEIITISNFTSNNPKIEVLFKPPQGGTVTEIDLNSAATKILYSGKGSENNWHLLEIDAKGQNLKQLTPKNAPYGSFDGAYLPDGRIVYCSTAPMQGLPCESGRIRMANVYLLDPKSGAIRRLTYDQDSDWNPTIMQDGRILFLRWEYSDLAHFFSRIMMTMNPDGSGQKMYYGSNSYWPNSMFSPKPIPGSDSKFITVVTGHHMPRCGRLCIFDVSLGRQEAEGVVQMLPGHGKKVEPQIADYLYSGHWPKFLSPFPLGTKESDGAGKYFLVSGKMEGKGLWGIYLIDIFDNIVKIYEEDGYAINEPIPFAKIKPPRTIPDRIEPKKKNANIYIANIYEGPGLEHVKIGTVKKLRLFTYHYSYYKSGSHEAVGCEASWDVKRILGEVPVYADGSASFQMPANLPVAIQPLDENGAAIQLMRSWIVAMPGETLACVGCHENPSMAVPSKPSIATNSKPSRIANWYGPSRNFSFLKEVQPVLQKNCIACHNPRTDKKTFSGEKLPDFETLTLQPLDYQDGLGSNAKGGPFSESYNNLNPYIRRPGPESDIHLLNPYEYHISTSILFQKLNRNHHDVKLNKEDLEKLAAWTDLNVPFWGSWTDVHRDWANEMHRQWSGSGGTRNEQLANIQKYSELRNKLQKEYAGVVHDFESDQYSLAKAKEDLAKIKPITPKASAEPKKISGIWKPANADEAKQMQDNKTKSLNIAGEEIVFRKIPAGKFVMGNSSYRDAQPKEITIAKDFYMAEKETSNKLYKQFKKNHQSGFIDELGKDHTRPGIPANEPDQPVIRISWSEATSFTKWASEKTGKKVRLPTEEEWEYAARAGTKTPFYWGDFNANFGEFANLADKSMEKFKARQTFNYYLRINNVNDGAQVEVPSGRYKANAFGLYDMIGNVAEWTSSSYEKSGEKVSRGGSWNDLPVWVDVAVKVPYLPFQKVYNVGIRLVFEE